MLVLSYITVARNTWSGWLAPTVFAPFVFCSNTFSSLLSATEQYWGYIFGSVQSLSQFWVWHLKSEDQREQESFDSDKRNFKTPNIWSFWPSAGKRTDLIGNVTLPVLTVQCVNWIKRNKFCIDFYYSQYLKAVQCKLNTQCVILRNVLW